MSIKSFSEAYSMCEPGKTSLLLGNGFSRALREDVFSYNALFSKAEFTQLSNRQRQLFSFLDTKDFEYAMRAIRNTIKILPAFGEYQDLKNSLEGDYEKIKEALVKTISDNHLERPHEVGKIQYAYARQFLSKFKRIYTLNYDLLLYWSLMQEEIPPPFRFDDGFRTPESGEAEYVTWDVFNSDKQNIFYLHGALHLFDGGHEIRKYTWNNTRIALIDQIRSALSSGLFPIYVSEGSSEYKIEKIKHSELLSRAFRSFCKIGNDLFILGWSIGPQDDHILTAIRESRIKRIFVGLFGDPDSQSNRITRSRASALSGLPRERKVSTEVIFYDTASAKVWS